MDAFSYLSVLLAIIVGLGMTQVLTASGRLIRHRASVKFYWPPLLWAAVLLLVYVQAWWAMFGLRAIPSWRFIDFAVVLTKTVALYMMAAVALPEQIEGGEVDLRSHYDRQARWFFGFFLATLFVSVMQDVVLGGRLPNGENFSFHIGLAAICVAGMVVRRTRGQKLVAATGAAAVVLYIIALFSRLH